MTYLDHLAHRIEDAIPRELRPQDDAARLYRLYALLALVKGGDVTAEDVHDAWAVWMIESDPHHRSLIPFPELSATVRRSDQPFVDAIRKVVRDG